MLLVGIGIGVLAIVVSALLGPKKATRTKLMAYIIGAIWGGFAGTLMGAHLSAISPNSFLFLYSALVLMAVVLGGMASTPGVIIGALFVSLAPEFLREFAEWRFLLFGLLLVVTMVFRLKGIWPENAVLPFLKKREVPQAVGTDEAVEPDEPSANAGADDRNVAVEPEETR